MKSIPSFKAKKDGKFYTDILLLKLNLTKEQNNMLPI